MTRRIFPILCMAALCAVLPLTVSAQETTYQGRSSLANAEKNRYGLCWEGKPSGRNPIFDNVERVAIFIQAPSGFTPKEIQESFPLPLRLENLKETLKDIYTARYEKFTDRQAQTHGCYNRNNQKVDVTYLDSREDREKAKEIAKDPAVLFVLASFNVTDIDDYKPKHAEPSIAMSLVHYRASPETSIIDEVQSPKVFPLSMSEENARKHIIDFITARIY